MPATAPRFVLLCAAALVAAVPLRASHAAPAWAYKWAPGDRLVYKIDYRSTSELNFGGLIKGRKGPAQGHGGNADNDSTPQKLRVHISGNLIETVIAQADGKTTVAFALEAGAVKLVTDDGEMAEQADAIRDGLAKTVLAWLDDRGRITGVRFADQTTPEVQLAARALYSLFQVVLPDGEATPKSWRTKEVEPNGEYTAKYTQAGAAKSGLRKLRKRKVSFTEDAPAEGPHEITVKKTIKPAGELVAQFDVANGRVAGLRGDDREEVLLNGRAVGRASVKLSLSLTSAAKADDEQLKPLQQAASGGAQFVTLKTVESKEAVETAIESNELKGESADAVFAQLAKLEESGGEEQPIYLKVKALLSVQPQAAARAGGLLGKSKADGPTVRILAGALGTVGNADCQAALAAAAKARPADDPGLSAILPAMGELAQPLPVAEAALRGMATSDSEGDGASTARLALGTMASTLGKTDAARGKKIVADLIALYGSAKSDEVKRQLLLALGNSASPDALPSLQAAAGDKNAMMREAAVKAAGQIKSPDADHLLAAAAKDADEHVRKAATDAQANRKKKD